MRLMVSKRKWIVSLKHQMPQMLNNPSETLGGVPNDSTIARKFLGEAATFRNAKFFARKGRPIMVNQSYWVNDVLSPIRIKVMAKLRLSTLIKILDGVEVVNASDYLPFPINAVSILQSVVPVMPPKKKIHWSTSDRRYEKYLSSDYNNTSGDGELEPLMYMPNGGWEFVRPHLLRFTETYCGSLSTKEILNIVDKASYKWEIPVFDFIPQKSEIKYQYVNPDAFSGFWTSKFFGMTKRQALDPANEMAMYLYDLISSRLIPNTSLVTLGGRNKVIKYKDIGGVTVSRVVMQEETPVTQIKQIFARPITNAYQVLNKIEIQEHGIGIDFLGTGWTLFCDKILTLGSRVLVGDVVSSDSSIREDVLLIAFAILRVHYPKSKELDRFFFFFTSGHVYKRVVIPGGYIYLLTRGIQSGCAFTAHLNTIVTRIMLLCIIDRMRLKFHRLVTYGDDWLLFLKQSNVNVLELESVVYEILGIKLKDVSYGNIDNGSSESNVLTFLKTGYYNGLPGRQLKEVMIKLMYSEKYSRRNILQMHEVLVGMFLYSFGNFGAAGHIIDYIRFVCKDKKLLAENLIDKMININFKVFFASREANELFYIKRIYVGNTKRYYGKPGIFGKKYGSKNIFDIYLRNVILGIRNERQRL